MVTVANHLQLAFFFIGSAIIRCSCDYDACIKSDSDSNLDDLALSLLQKKTLKAHGRFELTPSENIYLDTVRDTLTGTILRTPGVKTGEGAGDKLERIPFDADMRWGGSTWCEECFTMAGGARVQNVRELVIKSITEQVPGDFLEAGSWRGGCSIMARVVQRVMHEEAQRRTYVCDSFSGLPPSSTPQDSDRWSNMNFLEVSQEEVAENFKSFQALDDNVLLRKGFFSESLPKVRHELKEQGRQIAVLRGDGDMYESFMDILYNLYEFVPVGGYFICDDCPKIAEAQRAIDDFRKHHGISAPMVRVEGSAYGSFWRKEVATDVDYNTYLLWNSTRSFRAKSAV